MIFSVKPLTASERNICDSTLSPRAIYAIVGHHVAEKTGCSIVRMGDGEAALLEAPDGQPFNTFTAAEAGWNSRLGIAELPIEDIKKNILAAGNTCTYFAPSISGISLSKYKLHHHFTERKLYVDNFFVNDWTFAMIKQLLNATNGAFIMHKEYESLIQNFATTYDMEVSAFDGFKKLSARDNDAAVQAALASQKQLILFSAGPAGKIIGPKLEREGLVALDIGNTLPNWSLGNPRS